MTRQIQINRVNKTIKMTKIHRLNNQMKIIKKPRMIKIYRLNNQMKTFQKHQPTMMCRLNSQMKISPKHQMNNQIRIFLLIRVMFAMVKDAKEIVGVNLDIFGLKKMHQILLTRAGTLTIIVFHVLLGKVLLSSLEGVTIIVQEVMI